MAIRLTLGAAIVLFLAGPLEAKPIDKEFHETFEVEKGVTLVLQHGDGDVSIEPWDRDVIQVDVVYRAEEHRWAFGDHREFEVDFEQTKNEVRVRERSRSGVSIGIHTTVDREYRYTIKAPSYVVLDLTGDDGDVELEGWEASATVVLDDGNLTINGLRGASLEVEIEDGEIRLLDVEADVWIAADDADVRMIGCRLGEAVVEMEDGDLTVRDSAGDFDITLDDGSVDVDDSRIQRLRVHAEDASLSFEGLMVENIDWDIRTDDGDVKVVLEDKISVAFSIDSDDGRIDLDLSDSSAVKESRRHASGQLHGGQGDLRIRTQDGEVRLRQRG